MTDAITGHGHTCIKTSLCLSAPILSTRCTHGSSNPQLWQRDNFDIQSQSFFEVKISRGNWLLLWGTEAHRSDARNKKKQGSASRYNVNATTSKTWSFSCCYMRQSCYFVQVSHFYVTPPFFFFYDRMYILQQNDWIVSRYHMKLSHYFMIIFKWLGAPFFSVAAMHFRYEAFWETDRPTDSQSDRHNKVRRWWSLLKLTTNCFTKVNFSKKTKKKSPLLTDFSKSPAWVQSIGCLSCQIAVNWLGLIDWWQHILASWLSQRGRCSSVV